MKYIPNFITSLNLASGFIAIIFILNGDIYMGSWLMLAAMVFDFLDGFSARALKAYSEIGKELDSLADVVSFGVAPGLIMYNLISAALIPGSHSFTGFSGFLPVVSLVIPAVMPVCAALRLAVFNLDTTQATTFKGLPTPANALAVISLVLGNHFSDSEFLKGFISSPAALIVLTLVLSGLMVTRIPLLSLKLKSMKIKGNEGRYLLIVLCAAMVSIFGIGSIPWIIPLYIVISLVSLLF